MAISFSEESLSDDAKKALKNAKNKSEYIRQAVEFYVSNAGVTNLDVITELRSIRDELSLMKSGVTAIQSHAVASPAVAIERQMEPVSISAEDQRDVRTYEAAIHEHMKNPVTHTLDEVERELGIKKGNELDEMLMGSIAMFIGDDD